MDDLAVLEWGRISPSYFKSRVDYSTDGPYLECSQWVQSALQSVQKMSTTKYDSQKLVIRLSQAAGEQSGISVSKAALMTLMAAGQ